MSVCQGLGLSFFVQCTGTKQPVDVKLESSTMTVLHVSFLGLAGILCATAAAAAFGGFKLTKCWCFALVGYYLAYMISEVVVTVANGQ